MNITEKTQELAQVIKETEEYKNLKSAQSRLQLDPKALDLVQQFQSHQQNVVEARQSGQQINQDTVTALQGLQGKMEENQTIKNLMDAQNSFEAVMTNVNRTLTTELG